MNETTTHHGQFNIIVLATQPRMLRQMMRRALQQMPGQRLVLETENLHQLTGILDRVKADWLIASLTDEDRLPDAIHAAMLDNPTLSVMGISEDASHVVVNGAEDLNGELTDARRSMLEDTTLAELLDVLDGAA